MSGVGACPFAVYLGSERGKVHCDPPPRSPAVSVSTSSAHYLRIIPDRLLWRLGSEIRDLTTYHLQNCFFFFFKSTRGGMLETEQIELEVEVKNVVTS